jgi:PAS domain-containing protein
MQNLNVTERLNLYASAFANALECMMIADESRRIIGVNRAFESTTGYSAEDRGREKFSVREKRGRAIRSGSASRVSSKMEPFTIWLFSLTLPIEKNMKERYTPLRTLTL